MTLVSEDEWKRFRYNVKNHNRYIFHSSLLDPQETSLKYVSSDEFLDELLQLLQAYKRFRVLEAETVLWRAQLGGTCYTPPPNTWIADNGSEMPLDGFSCRAFLKPHDRGRMIPYSDKAREGRMNPKGIPCLYTATAPRTALAEMKPMIGSCLTLAEFVTVRELKIVDFASDPIQLESKDGNPTDEEMDIMTWEDIGDAFSEPVTDSDNIADYAPTQIVAELFRRTGYDGIRYKSKLVAFESFEPLGSSERIANYAQAESAQAGNKRGRNIALFDVTSAKFKISKLYKFAADPRGVFDFRPVNIEIFCSDQIPEMD